MQREIKTIVEAAEEKPQRPWRITVPKGPVRKSAKWHMNHTPYQGGTEIIYVQK